MAQLVKIIPDNLEYKNTLLVNDVALKNLSQIIEDIKKLFQSHSVLNVRISLIDNEDRQIQSEESIEDILSSPFIDSFKPKELKINIDNNVQSFDLEIGEDLVSDSWLWIEEGLIYLTQAFDEKEKGIIRRKIEGWVKGNQIHPLSQRIFNLFRSNSFFGDLLIGGIIVSLVVFNLIVFDFNFKTFLSDPIFIIRDRPNLFVVSLLCAILIYLKPKTILGIGKNQIWYEIYKSHLWLFSGSTLLAIVLSIIPFFFK